MIFRQGELEELVQEVKGQLKKIAITASNRKDKVFLDIDMDRQGFISKENLQEMCLKQHLPSDAQIIDRVNTETRIYSGGRASTENYNWVFIPTKA